MRRQKVPSGARQRSLNRAQCPGWKRRSAGIARLPLTERALASCSGARTFEPMNNAIRLTCSPNFHRERLTSWSRDAMVFVRRRGSTSINCLPRSGLDEPDTDYYVKASDIPHSGKEVVDNPDDERATASEIDDTFMDMYFCTPADAAVAYSLWDMNNTTRLTTPREFDRMYPEAMRFLFWLRVHKHEVVSHEAWAKYRLYRRLVVQRPDD
jgi:hypothetical protein